MDDSPVLLRRLPKPDQPARPPMPLYRPHGEELRVRPCLRCNQPMWSLKAVRTCGYCLTLISMSGQLAEWEVQ